MPPAPQKNSSANRPATVRSKPKNASSSRLAGTPSTAMPPTHNMRFAPRCAKGVRARTASPEAQKPSFCSSQPVRLARQNRWFFSLRETLSASASTSAPSA